MNPQRFATFLIGGGLLAWFGGHLLRDRLRQQSAAAAAGASDATTGPAEDQPVPTSEASAAEPTIGKSPTQVTAESEAE